MPVCVLVHFWWCSVPVLSCWCSMGSLKGSFCLSLYKSSMLWFPPPKAFPISFFLLSRHSHISFWHAMVSAKGRANYGWMKFTWCVSWLKTPTYLTCTVLCWWSILVLIKIFMLQAYQILEKCRSAVTFVTHFQVRRDIQ